MVASLLPEPGWYVLTVRSSPGPPGLGRDLPNQFTFKTFCDWIRHELEEDFRRRWKIKANGLECHKSIGMAAAG